MISLLLPCEVADLVAFDDAIDNCIPTPTWDLVSLRCFALGNFDDLVLKNATLCKSSSDTVTYRFVNCNLFCTVIRNRCLCRVQQKLWQPWPVLCLLTCKTDMPLKMFKLGVHTSRLVNCPSVDQIRTSQLPHWLPYLLRNDGVLKNDSTILIGSS